MYSVFDKNIVNHIYSMRRLDERDVQKNCLSHIPRMLLYEIPPFQTRPKTHHKNQLIQNVLF